MKQAILAVSFGTTHTSAYKANIEAIEHEIQASLPAFEVRRAFTSGMVMKSLEKHQNIKTDSVAQALERLSDDGFETVFIQPTHVINGDEYEKLVKAAESYRSKFSKVAISAPLLTSTEDYKQIISALTQAITLESGEALILMGHGTTHYSNTAYAALDYMFKEAGHPNVFVGTVEGYPELPVVIKQLKNAGFQKVCLAPLMVVAGDHAVNDMAGDGDDSWKSILQDEGFAVRCIVKGLGEYKAVREIYVSHLKQIID